MIRRFLCTGCGVTLATELCLADDEPVLDARIDGSITVTA